MPELPEVETVRRGLEPAMTGARFDVVEARRPDLRFPLPDRFAARLEGARIEALERRGKYLLARLSTKETLIMHLGMSGRFTVEDGRTEKPGRFHRAGSTDSRHDHVVFMLENGGGPARVTYNDPRRFGFMDLAPTAALAASRHFAGMGPEPLSDDFSAEAFAALLAKRNGPVKAALLDQAVVAGVGNIYACETLFRAGVSPRRRGTSLGTARVLRIHQAVREVLVEAIAAGGSSLRDFAASDGALGYFQHAFRVYDREGQACPVCGNAIRRLVQSGRSTFYCGACQR